MRILVVEDEKKVARALQQGLEARNYEVTLAYTGEEGFFLVNAQTFDLLILDLMLPGRNGLEILATLRRQRLQTPVLILTARDALDDRVRGLDEGADDYLIKPFAFPELLARIRALLRRGGLCGTQGWQDAKGTDDRTLGTGVRSPRVLAPLPWPGRVEGNARSRRMEGTDTGNAP